MAVDDILTLAEARGAIRLPASNTSADTDLAGLYIPALTPIVEDIVGPVVQRSFTVVKNGGDGPLMLATHRLISITSVTESGVTLVAGTDYVAELSTGMLHRGTSTSVHTHFASGVNAVTVVYVAGVATSTATIPASIKIAGRIILAHLWQADQQGYRPDFGNPDESIAQTPAGFAIPRRAYALLEPYADRVPGFA